MTDLIPGTAMAASMQSGDSAFAAIEPILTATGGLTLAQVEGLTGLNGSTIQNWVKRGWVAAPVGKRYGRRQLMRIILINMLRDVMKLENIIAIMRYINGSVEDESDDIIPDERLYDHLCAVIAQARRLQTTDAAQIRRLICSRLDDTALAEASRGKLGSALLVMTLAYIAAQIKRQADLAYAALEIESL